MKIQSGGSTVVQCRRTDMMELMPIFAILPTRLKTNLTCIINIQSIPRSKHTAPELQNPVSQSRTVQSTSLTACVVVIVMVRCTARNTAVYKQPVNLRSQPSNSVHSCSRHGVVASRLTSERPGSVILFQKTFTVLSCF